MDILYSLFKTIAFRMDPELIHELSFSLIERFPEVLSFPYQEEFLDSKYSLNVGTQVWPFPVGLAAGLDKNASAISFFSKLPFGALEVGTVTPKPQKGNLRPRLFRYVKEQSIRNKMGFNNLGKDKIKENILHTKNHRKILGVNIGKNKSTKKNDAVLDYLSLYETFSPIADYLVINVSSPNTPGLRDLQKASYLDGLLNELMDLRKQWPVDLYLKVSPDLSLVDLDEIIDVALKHKLSGLVATNTTIMPELGDGGVSGRLLKEKSSMIREHILKSNKEKPGLELIGVGGISTFDDLWRFWLLGGKVVQIYSSFIFGGPKILLNFKEKIDQALLINQVPNVSELLKNIHEAKKPH